MKPWEIWTCDFPGAGSHPAVIVSNPERVANKPAINVLLCSSQRAGRPPGPTEILLDQADGLDWETLCKCDFFFALEKSDLTQRRGLVCPDRRVQIVRRIIASMAWPQF